MHRAHLEQIRTLQETQKCTFRPQINKNASNLSANNTMQIHERLFEESYRNGDMLKKAKIEQETSQMNEFTFSPIRKASSNAKVVKERAESST